MTKYVKKSIHTKISIKALTINKGINTICRITHKYWIHLLLSGQDNHQQISSHIKFLDVEKRKIYARSNWISTFQLRISIEWLSRDCRYFWLFSDSSPAWNVHSVLYWWHSHINTNSRIMIHKPTISERWFGVQCVAYYYMEITHNNIEVEDKAKPSGKCIWY